MINDKYPDQTVIAAFRFFAGLALILTIVSLMFFIPVVVDFLQTRYVEKVPTVVVCCFVFMAAIQSFFAGLILDSVKQKERQDFEIKLHGVTGHPADKEDR